MTNEVLWLPRPDAVETTNIGKFGQWLSRREERDLTSYPALWQYSVEHLRPFWGSVWEYFGLGKTVPEHRVLADENMPDTVWFPDESFNYARSVLTAPGVDGDEVLVSGYSDTRAPVEWTADDLREAVARARAGLLSHDVGLGDRVAAWMPNIPETLALMLASASLGAVFSSCAPEFGTRAVIDRFSQIEPKILVAVDGYRYGNKEIDRTKEVREVAAALPGLRRVVTLQYLGASDPEGETWDRFCAYDDGVEFEPVTFDHPLYVLYSSGTTGLPKAIVHGHGGMAVEHAKMHSLHHDLGPGDRFFWYSTTGWMMWNYLVSAPIVGAGVVLFDGAPDPVGMWRLAEESATTYFGTSAPFLMACRSRGIEPDREADLSRLRGVGSTGAPLPPAGFDYVYEHVAPSAQLQSLSGGTDVCTGFLGGAPTVPVWRGELSCRCLGANVQAFDTDGHAVTGREGELVVVSPMPSMPVGLWGDPLRQRYRDTYLMDFPGIWRHGDWITITDRGSAVISGRSDATLNRGGVRMGTAEFYSVVESIAGVADSLVVHLDDDDEDRLMLFVACNEDVSLDDAMRRRILLTLREQLSPRHVPDSVQEVPAVPRTLSGKKVEIPVKKILKGVKPEEAISKDALANPEALRAFLR
ncbi:acetoacetate--CoA ligase [Glycomyces xiaoerkulensis]|uniref:acetoacetate--CoA ligase n=1 Tax=Glycomyces xiaoerkulensis TaxID=2038139 RepID=UPI0018E49880|nr:acetoacetate--CoA ligase [Glycomyces xiaoerkulensis]